MSDATTQSAVDSEEPRIVVRRFDSRKNVKRARKRGLRVDGTKGIGIPATTIDIEPVDPDRIKMATGARNADAWMDIVVTGKNVLRRSTKEGRKEIVILEDVLPGDVVASGRTLQTEFGLEKDA